MGKFLFEPTAEKAKIYWTSTQSFQYLSIGCNMRRIYSCITKQKQKHTGECKELMRNLVQQNLRVLVIQKSLRSIKFRCFISRKSRAETMKPVKAGLTEGQFDASRAFTNIGADYTGFFIVKIGQRSEKRWCSLFTF